MDNNLLSPKVQANPFPYYAQLRRHTPVLWSEPLQAWLVSRYRDVDYALRNPQLFSSAGWLSQLFGELNPVPEVRWMLELDPPDHTRVRKLVNKAFTPRLIKSLEPYLQGLVQELLAALPAHQEFDFVQTVATPLPVIVIAELLGVDPAHRDAFKRSWVRCCDKREQPPDRRSGEATHPPE
jgi:cytochrome P450